jgi:hypothetical protein
MKNARFWDFVNEGYVKLTLKPGQKIRFGHSGPDEEGWHYERYMFEHSDDGLGIVCHRASGGRDCDGRIDEGATHFAAYDRLAVHGAFIQDEDRNPSPESVARAHHDGRRIMQPDWNEIRHGIRDHSAELANY